jgi:L-iditol 2-dehydrogenase
MRAVRVGTPGGVEALDVERPSASHGDVLVEVDWAAICATDRKLVARGSDPPRVIGHEAVGHLQDGVLVGVHPDIGCGRCEQCESGYENRCPNRSSIGLDRDGGMAEWVRVPPSHAVPLEGVEPEIAPLLEPLACCLHAVELLKPRRNEKALIVGAGSMGILAMWSLQAAGCAVAVIQRSPARRELAHELGAVAAMSPAEDPAASLGGSPSVAIVTAPGAEALSLALDRVAVGGRVHAFAGTAGGAEVDANLVHYRHLQLVGSTGSTLRDYERARDLVSSGEIKLDRMPRSRVTIDEIPELLTSEPSALPLKAIVDVKAGSR